MDYDRALELVGKLEAAGVVATVDPRSATPPCVLGEYPARDYSVSFCGYRAEWRWHLLAPATGNADAWRLLDELADAVADVLPVTRMDPEAYRPSPDSPPLPGYRVTFTEPLTEPPDVPALLPGGPDA